MDRAFIACQWVLAAGVIGTLAAIAARGRLPRPWAAMGLAGVAVTNLGTIARGLDAPDPSGPWVAAAMLAWSLVLLTFPDGVPAPAWMRWVVGVAVAVILVSLVVPLGGVLRPIAFLLAFAAGVASQVWRFRRRSSVSERQATKWLLVGLVPAASVFIGVGLVVSTTRLDPVVLDQSWYGFVSVAGIWLVPVAGTVGLATGDRAPVDGILQGLMVTSGVAVAVAWAYFSLQPLIGPTWSAAAAAALVLPAYVLARRAATNVVYARGYGSPVALLERTLTSAVREQDVARVVATTVATSLGVPHVTVLLNGETAALVGDRSGVPEVAPEVFGVRYQGEEVAQIVVSPRVGERTLAGRDRTLLDGLAASAGAALHGAATMRELTRARERLVLSREEERRRLRRDLHDDLAPTLAGLRMRAAAAATLGNGDGERARQLNAEVQTGLQSAIAQVRQIAYDLRPPMLDDAGLEAAIRERLGTAMDPDLSIKLDVLDLPPHLPAAIELAALRVVQEAVTNVRRHAGASTCDVVLARTDEHIRITVADDGQGIGVGHRRGVGLRSMHERASELGGCMHVATNATGGTTVTVLLPIKAAVAP